MKATQFYVSLLLLAGIFLLNACQEDDITVPNGIKINFQAVTGLKSSADTLMIEEAFIGIETIDLKREGEADSATVEKIVYDGPYVVNLLNGTVSPAIRWIFAEPGYYREINVTTSNALPQGNSIILKGTVYPADGNEKIPFEMFSSGNHALTIKNNTGITISEGENVDLLVVFDLSDLFREVDLNEFDRNEQGVVVISEDAGTSTLTSMISAFEAFSSFGFNDGFPLPGGEDVIPDNETPGEVDGPEEGEEDDSGQEENGDNSDDENPDEENENSDNDPEGGAGDEQDDGSSDEEPGDTGNNNGGTTDENEDEDSAGDDDNDSDEGDNDGNSGNGNGGIPADDDDDDSENGDDENSGDGDNDEDTDGSSGSDQDEQDDDDENTDENDSGNDSQDDDDDERDDDDGEDDGSDDDNEDDSDKEDNENKGKGNNSGKGNDKDKDKGNKGKGKK